MSNPKADSQDGVHAKHMPFYYAWFIWICCLFGVGSIVTSQIDHTASSYGTYLQGVNLLVVAALAVAGWYAHLGVRWALRKIRASFQRHPVR